MNGYLYMVERVKEVEDKIKLELKRVYLEINKNVLSIGETEEVNDKMEVIKEKNIYPREQELESAVGNENSVDKIKGLNIVLHSLDKMYCFVLVSENNNKQTRFSHYHNSLNAFPLVIKQLKSED